MMFAVFVGYYLYLDHAPPWVWALAIAAFAYDLYQERRQ